MLPILPVQAKYLIHPVPEVSLDMQDSQRSTQTKRLVKDFFIIIIFISDPRTHAVIFWTEPCTCKTP